MIIGFFRIEFINTNFLKLFFTIIKIKGQKMASFIHRILIMEIMLISIVFALSKIAIPTINTL